MIEDSFFFLNKKNDTLKKKDTYIRYWKALKKDGPRNLGKYNNVKDIGGTQEIYIIQNLI